jgi:hypothetical protein
VIWDDVDATGSSYHGSVRLTKALPMLVNPGSLNKHYSLSQGGTVHFNESCFNLNTWRVCPTKFVCIPKAVCVWISNGIKDLTELSNKNQKSRQSDLNMLDFLLKTFSIAERKSLYEQLDLIDRIIQYYFETGFPNEFKISKFDELIDEIYSSSACDYPEEWNELRENIVDIIGNDLEP